MLTSFEISGKLLLKISILQAAAIDPTRLISGTNETQAARHMFVDGIAMREHYYYDAWCERANEFIPLSKRIQRRIGYYVENITLKNLIAVVKNKPIK